MTEQASEERAHRALDRQLLHQEIKAERFRGHERQVMASMLKHSFEVQQKVEAHRPISADTRVLEVGSGSHGLIFFFEAGECVGVDPLADEYRELFSAWQGRAKTIAAFGEELPFEDSTFDVVLCDNVVDHAQSPRRVIEEICRVLVPGGILYFTVNIHHPFYSYAAKAYAAWHELGLPGEIGPFADHTVHLTLGQARELFAGLPLTIVEEKDPVPEAKRAARTRRVRNTGDRLKRIFFKNARWEAIAVKDGELAPSTPAA